MNNQRQYQYIATMVVEENLFPHTILRQGDGALIVQEVVRIVCREAGLPVRLVPVRESIDVRKVAWDAEHYIHVGTQFMKDVESCSNYWDLRKRIPQILLWLENFLNNRGVLLLFIRH